MHPTTLYYALTLLLASTTTSPIAAAAPLPQPPNQFPPSSSTSSSIFTTHFHSLLSPRDSAHARLLLESPRRDLLTSSNLLPRSDPNAATLHPSSSSRHNREDEESTSASPVPSRSFETTFRSPRLDGRRGRVSQGGWLSWVAAAPRGVRGGREEEKRWRAWEGVDHSI